MLNMSYMSYSFNNKNKKNKIFTSIVIILLFSIIYYLTVQTYGSEKEKDMFKTYHDSLYFSTITFFTIGFGDIHPTSIFMKYLTMLQSLLAFICIL